MADTFCIHLESGERASWCLPGHAPEAGTLREAAERGGTRRAVVLAPTAEITLTGANLPTAQRQRLRQAVPFALEEQLAVDVEQLHFALGPREKSGWVPVAVTDRACMDRWSSALEAAGVQAAAMLPDVLALPRAEEGWTVMLAPERVLLRTGEASGYAFERAHAAMLFELALAQAEVKPAVLQLYDCAEPGPELEGIQRAAEAAGLSVTDRGCYGGLLSVLAQGLGEQLPLNLLQGEYSRREKLGKLWRPWKPAAAVLGVLLVLQAVMAGVTYSRLSSEADRLSRRIDQIYRQAFPDARHVVNPRAQMERRLAALRGGGESDGFQALMGKAGPILASAGDMELTGLRYKDSALQLDLQLKSLQALDDLKGRLTDTGLAVDIETANSQSGRVESRLTVREVKR